MANNISNQNGEDLVPKLFKEEFAINETIEISDFYKKYFTPIDFSVKSKDENSETTKIISNQRENNRIINETFHMIFEQSEDGGRYYHDDYRIYELISLVFFKKDLNELPEFELKVVNDLFNQILDIFLLYKVDYWNSYYSQYHESISKAGFNEDIEEIAYLRKLLDKWENISNVEISLRKKDEYGSVIISETQKVIEEDLKLMLEPFIKRKYYDFINTYKLESEISIEEKLEYKQYPNQVNFKFTLTSFISEAIAILNFEGIKPSISFEYFDSLYTMVHNNTHFETRLKPTYDFLKVVVPALNRFLEDHAIKGFKKKHKHMLIFSLLRSFSFIPDKKGLELNGNEDVKEDFIKQLLR